MTFRRLAHRAAIRAEGIFDRVRPRRNARPLLEAYRGYSTPDNLIVRGRVLTSLRRTAPDPEQSKWANLKQMASLFMTDEVANVSVSAVNHDARTLSDEEGYFTLTVPRGEDMAHGWGHVLAAIDEGTGPIDCPVLIPDANARFGVISDIDDTMMQTGAFSLARNLWTTFTGSALTRHVFDDSVALMRALVETGDAPVYYVSSSPWNLHHFLDRVLLKAGLPAGPMFLRDLGISETQFVSGTHGDHKGEAVDRILDANPDLPFVLLGDTGQHDGEVYRDAIARHAGRIAAVALREPKPGHGADVAAALEAIRQTGTPVFSGPDFASMHVELLSVLRPDSAIEASLPKRSRRQG